MKKLNDFTLKEAYSIWWVSVRFESDIHVMGIGFTKTQDLFAVARSEQDAACRVEEYFKKQGLIPHVRKAVPAQNQNIQTYVTADRMPGFMDGANYPTFPPSPYTREEAKRMVNAAFSMSVNGNTDRSSLQVLAGKFLELWSSLGFLCFSAVAFQRSGLKTLRELTKEGPVNLSDDLERLHSLAGMFNQTYSYAVNLKG